MKNKEKIKDDLIDLITEHAASFDFGVSSIDYKPHMCSGTKCTTCIFKIMNENESCEYNRKKWLNSNHKEINMLSENEYTILSNIEKNYKYIGRNSDGYLFLCKDQFYIDNDYFTWNKDFSFYNKLFQFIKSDSKGVWNINKLLDVYLENKQGEER